MASSFSFSFQNAAEGGAVMGLGSASCLSGCLRFFPSQALAGHQSAFFGTRPILVRMFLRRKKASVLAAQVISATQKAVPQL